MAVKRYTVQDGVFVHERIGASIKDTPLKEFEEGLKRSLEESDWLYTITGRLERLEIDATAVLEEPLPQIKTTSKNRLNETKAAAQRRKRDAKEILDQISWVRKFISEKNIEQAALEALRLGELAIVFNVRKVEYETLKGIKSLKGTDNGGNSRKSLSVHLYERWQDDANEIWERNPRLKKIEVARSLYRKYNNDETLPEYIRKPDTIARNIKKPI